MKYARTPTGDLVDGATFRGGAKSLTCPNCGEPVHFRQSSEKESHFAHNPGVGTPDCDLFNPSAEATEAQALRLAFRKSLRLYFRYVVGHQNKIDWQLCLRIPAIEDLSGELRIIDGLSGVVTVQLKQLISGARLIPLKIGPIHYRVVPHGVPAEAKEYFEKGCEGIRFRTWNVFRYSQTNCRMLTDNEPIYWGRKYFILCNAESAPTLPPFLRHQALGPSHPIRCYLVELPNKEDLQTKQQTEIETFTRISMTKELQVPPPQLRLLTPEISYDDFEECFFVDKSKPVMISLAGERGTPSVKEILLQDYSGKKIQSLALNQRPPICFLENESREYYEYSLWENKYERLTIKSIPRSTVHPISPANFIFRAKNAAFPEPIPCMSSVLEERLRSVSSGDFDLEEIVGKNGLIVSIGLGGADGVFHPYYYTYILNGVRADSPQNVDGQVLAQKISEIVKSHAPFSIRFGNFSFLSYNAGQIAPNLQIEIREETERRSNSLNSRQRWYETYQKLSDEHGRHFGAHIFLLNRHLNGRSEAKGIE